MGKYFLSARLSRLFGLVDVLLQLMLYYSCPAVPEKSNEKKIVNA